MRRKPTQARAERVKSTIRLTTQDGVSGVITDISSAGMLLELPEKQEPGSVITFSVEVKTPGGPLKLNGEGEVVRVVEESGKYKVAAKTIKPLADHQD
jgi:hypothetical protein